VVIAKLDATANDIPSDKFPVRGYPTLFYRKASGEGESLSTRKQGRTRRPLELKNPTPAFPPSFRATAPHSLLPCVTPPLF